MGKWVAIGAGIFIMLLALFWGGERFMVDRNEANLERQWVTVLPDFEKSRYHQIYLAGGCFWGVQAWFDRLVGVVYTDVGYANGDGVNANYRSLHETGHAETVQVIFDPETIRLEDILEQYYQIIDPTSENRQGNDIGSQYRTGIYYTDPEDLPVIQAVTRQIATAYQRPIVTEIEPLQHYILAEDNHQDYLKKNPGGYCHIQLGAINNARPVIDPKEYPKPTDKKMKEKLTTLAYQVTQENATEQPFSNPYWDNHEQGLYVDVVTGEPLFLSLHKFDSGTGWPSFTRPVDWDVVQCYRDTSASMERIEVRSRSGDSHLGHVFQDGPVAEGGLRYCINSAALLFIPLEKLEEQGYDEFTVYFD